VSPESYNVYWCSPATFMDDREVWILFRKNVQPVGDSGWERTAADMERRGPERVAYRVSGERHWKKWDNHLILEIDDSRREEVPEPEAVAILLMTKK